MLRFQICCNGCGFTDKDLKMQTTSVKVPQIVDEVNIEQECPATLDTEEKRFQVNEEDL